MGARDEVVVVTGSSGFLGSAIVSKLAERYRVVGFDRGVSSHPPAVAECICVDVTSDSSVAAGMDYVRLMSFTFLRRIIWPPASAPIDEANAPPDGKHRFTAALIRCPRPRWDR